MTFPCQWGRVKRFFSFCEYFYAAVLQRQKPSSAEPGWEGSAPGTGSCRKINGAIPPLPKKGPPPSLCHQRQVADYFCAWVLHPENINQSLRTGSNWICEQFDIFLLFCVYCLLVPPPQKKKKKNYQRDKSLWYFSLSSFSWSQAYFFFNLVGLEMGDVILFSCTSLESLQVSIP